MLLTHLTKPGVYGIFYAGAEQDTLHKALLLLLKLLLAQEQQLLETVRNAKGQVTTGETVLCQCERTKCHCHVSAV